jgi:hypothetical protein
VWSHDSNQSLQLFQVQSAVAVEVGLLEESINVEFVVEHDMPNITDNLNRYLAVLCWEYPSRLRNRKFEAF